MIADTERAPHSPCNRAYRNTILRAQVSGTAVCRVFTGPFAEVQKCQRIRIA